jgi:hypothetical protein
VSLHADFSGSACRLREQATFLYLKKLLICAFLAAAISVARKRE